MRILIHSVSYPPRLSGVAVFTHALAKRAASQGHEVLVVTGSSTLRRRHSHDGVPGSLKVIELASVGNPYHQELRLPLASPRAIGRILTDFRPDIVHCQDPTPSGLMLITAARKRKIPVIATHHFSSELVQAYQPRWLWPLVEPALDGWLKHYFSHCQLITAPSEKTAADVRALNVSAPVVVMSNGVEVERFGRPVPPEPLRARFHLPGNEPLLLYVGRLDPDKSVDVLIRSLAIVRATRPAHLVIVGDGGDAKALQALARKLGLADAITFTGRIPHHQRALAGLCQLADLFVIASTIETQGIAVIEAMAAGCPVVAARANALPELVRDGRTGQLVEPADPAAFAAATLHLLADPAQRTALAHNAQVAAQAHDLPHCLDAFLATYKTLIH